MSRMPGLSTPHREHAVSAALQRLTTEPTNAQIIVRPTGEHPATDAADPRSTVAGWWRCDTLRQPSFWQRLAPAYSAGLGTKHHPVGGACALQHYAGRFVLAALGVWVQTGSLLSVEHGQWHVRLDDNGRTTGVAPAAEHTAAPTGVTDAAHALLQEHMRPIVDAVTSASRITDRVAYGCIAASCAGAFATLHRRAPAHRRTDLATVARQFLASTAWPGDRDLVELAEIPVQQGTGLVHKRHTCCLIRLGADRGACGPCPDIDPDERWTRLTRNAARAHHTHDLPVATHDD